MMSNPNELKPVLPKTLPLTWTSLLRRRALDLFVIAWIAAVGMTTGRQLVDWWREDPSTVPQPVRDTGEDWYRRPVEFSIGQRGLPMYRSPFVGSRDEVERQLLQLVQSRLKDASLPDTLPDADEQSFLEKLRAELPIATDHGRGTLYRWPAPWPGVVGTLSSGETERMIAHGFAVPSGNEKWTVFVLSSLALRGGRDSHSMLPPGALPLLSWTDEEGRRVSTFRGTGSLAEWATHWEQRHRSDVRAVQEVTETTATLQFRTEKFVTEIQMQRAEDGKLTGVCWTIPLAPRDTLQSLPTNPVTAAERSSKDSP